MSKVHIYPITRYPRQAELRGGGVVQLRPMTPEDGDALLAFFRRIPEEDRFFLKDDVTSPTVIRAWAENLDYDRALPLLATVNGRIVGDAALIRHRGGPRRHLAEIRVVIDPDYRGRGLGVAMMRELVEIAYDAGLEMVVFELVPEAQDDAIKAAQFLGAFEAGRVTDLVKDMHGRPHDVVFLVLPLGKWWEWSQF
jgi:GNAT superfamily N-acetyltransferase